MEGDLVLCHLLCLILNLVSKYIDSEPWLPALNCHFLTELGVRTFLALLLDCTFNHRFSVAALINLPPHTVLLTEREKRSLPSGLLSLSRSSPAIFEDSVAGKV